jgi:hypothetical protein
LPKFVTLNRAAPPEFQDAPHSGSRPLLCSNGCVAGV